MLIMIASGVLQLSVIVVLMHRTLSSIALSNHRLNHSMFDNGYHLCIIALDSTDSQWRSCLHIISSPSKNCTNSQIVVNTICVSIIRRKVHNGQEHLPTKESSAWMQVKCSHVDTMGTKCKANREAKPRSRCSTDLWQLIGRCLLA